MDAVYNDCDWLDQYCHFLGISSYFYCCHFLNWLQGNGWTWIENFAGRFHKLHHSLCIDSVHKYKLHIISTYDAGKGNGLCQFIFLLVLCKTIFKIPAPLNLWPLLLAPVSVTFAQSHSISAQRHSKFIQIQQKSQSFGIDLSVAMLILDQHFSLDPGTTQECGYQIRVLAGHCGLGVFWSYWNCSRLLFHKQYERRGKIKWTWINTYQKILELWMCWHSLVGSYFRIQGI